jgi:hypothetical protein
MITRRRQLPLPPPRISEKYLRAILDGIAFPASRWLIVTWADYNGASVDIQTKLRGLSERTYRSYGDVEYEIKQITAIRQAATSRQPPRHQWTRV